MPRQVPVHVRSMTVHSMTVRQAIAPIRRARDRPRQASVLPATGPIRLAKAAVFRLGTVRGHPEPGLTMTAHTRPAKAAASRPETVRERPGHAHTTIARIRPATHRAGPARSETGRPTAAAVPRADPVRSATGRHMAAAARVEPDPVHTATGPHSGAAAAAGPVKDSTRTACLTAQPAAGRVYVRADPARKRTSRPSWTRRRRNAVNAVP